MPPYINGRRVTPSRRAMGLGDGFNDFAGDWCQSGSAARKAVADVGSGGNLSSTSAGSLHLVQCLALFAGRTKRRNQPIARAAWAPPSYPGRDPTATGPVAAILRPSPPRAHGRAEGRVKGGQ